MSSPDPRSGIGILPRGVCHLSFPFSSRTRFSRSVPKPVLSSCRLYTGCHRDRKQVSSRLLLEPMAQLQFRQRLNGITMRHRTVCFRSSPQHSPDALDWTPFPQSFTTTPFERSSTGQFEACSCKPTSGGRLPSLVQHHELALVFVTHAGDTTKTQRAHVFRSRFQ